MPLFTRKAADLPIDHTLDDKVVKANARLADLDALIHASHDRLVAHADAVATAQRDVDRAALEVLAGAGSDANLANKQAVLLDAQRKRAIDTLAIEDAEAEANKLRAQLPGLVLAAKHRSAKSLRAKYLTIANELRAGLEAAADADARLAALTADALRLFPSGDRQDFDATGHVIRGLGASAGCPAIQRTGMRGNRTLYWERAEGVAHQWLERVNAAIAEVERLAREQDA